MTTTIETADNITVRWTEAACFTDEMVTMTPAEFRTVLSRIRDEWERDGNAGYCKVAFLANGKSYRIDVDARPESTDLRNAWLY